MRILTGIFFVALLLMFLPANVFAETDMPYNDLTVQFDLERGTVTGVSKISLPAGRTARINLTGIKVTSASISDMALRVEPGTELLTFTPGSARDILKIEYEAEYRSVPEIEKTKNTVVTQGNSISSEGILLTENWHPAVEGISLYRLTAVLPSEFEGVSEAEEVQIIEHPEAQPASREYVFNFNHPLRTLTLIAGRYKVAKENYGEIEISTYLFPDDKALSKTYIEDTKKYLDMYEKYLGKYPFKRFAVAENFMPSEYVRPTLTLLGKGTVNKPFTSDTSLGRNILQQWLGHLVYIDDKSGNWSEGLSAYLADHMNEESMERGWEYRKQILTSFQSYVTDENDLPLQSYSNQGYRASAAIEQGKSTMVFHMLRKLVGDEIFFSSLRSFVEKNSFKAASWSDIRNAFESGYGESLEWFFKQWVDESGLPELEISNVELKYRGAKAVISFIVEQKAKNYKLLLPVVVKLREGEVRKIFVIEKTPKTSVEIEIGIEDTPVSLIIDDSYDLFRRLSEGEFPPVISRILGDDNKIFVMPQDKEALYDGLSGFLRKEGFTEKKESEVSYDDIRNNSLFIPDVGTALVKRLFGKIEEQSADFYLITRENPFNKKGVITIAGSPDSSGLQKYMQNLTDYCKYSNLAFKEDRNILKTVSKTERGIKAVIVEDIPGVEIPRITDMYGVIEKAIDKDIIYVGEGHDRFEHHRVQLLVIMEAYKKNKKIAIGMEMFQKSQQQAIDDYIEGRTDEKTFLKKSEYFKNWGFDYNLYREILLFAREYKIPVIALNIRKELVSKVSKNGLQALTADELKEVPEYFDLSDRGYQERLRDIFERHARSTERNFDFFYQAQVLWDEAMANNMDEFIRKNPDHKVVLLAGVGHMIYGSGIPKRLFRLNKKDYAVILNAGDAEKDIADFLLFPATISLPESPKLGVILKEEDKKIIISQFSSDSIAEQAGLEVDDIVISLDDTIVESVDEIRIFLLSKKKGDEITVKVSRKRLLFGPGEREFKIVL